MASRSGERGIKRETALEFCWFWVYILPEVEIRDVGERGDDGERARPLSGEASDDGERMEEPECRRWKEGVGGGDTDECL